MDDPEAFAWYMVALCAIVVALIGAVVWMGSAYVVVEKTEILEVTGVIVDTRPSSSLLKDAHNNVYNIRDPFLAEEISKSIGLYKVKMNPIGLYPITVARWEIFEAEKVVE